MVNASLTLPVSSTSWLRTSGANFVGDIVGGTKAALILMFGLESYASLILSWMFVIARYWHSYEHVINNSILRRTIAFGLSSITHLMIWGLFFNELAQF